MNCVKCGKKMDENGNKLVCRPCGYMRLIIGYRRDRILITKEARAYEYATSQDGVGVPSVSAFS